MAEKAHMSTKAAEQLVREGDFVAEVDVHLIEADGEWAPYISLDDACRLERCAGSTAVGRPAPRVAIGEWGLQAHASDRVEKTPANTRMEPTPLVRSRVPAGAAHSQR
jgi:hypothetical protein